MADDSSVTGLIIGSLAVSYSTETAFVPNHIGSDVSMALFNDSSETTLSGVVAVKGTGLVPDLAAAITLANDSVDTLAIKSKNLFTTPASNAGLVVTGATMTRANREFETGDITAIYKPLIATNAPATVT